jgi:hypothetical protein
MTASPKILVKAPAGLACAFFTVAAPAARQFFGPKTQDFSVITLLISGSVKMGCAMKDELADKFPKLILQECELQIGEWIIASPHRPLTQVEAEKVVLAYQTIQELVARGSGPVGH